MHKIPALKNIICGFDIATMVNSSMDEQNEEGGSKMTEKMVGTEKKEKFVPTCHICGEKHWPHHMLIPCFNKNKAKAKAKA